MLPPDEIRRAKEAGVVAVKLYPAGATTNSDAGVTDIRKTYKTLEAMQKHGLVLTRAEALESAQADLKPATFTPVPGDALFWDHNGNGDPDHVNMLHHVDDAGVLYTIGGNEGNEESGAPVRVKRRGLLEELGRVLGFGRMYRSR